MIDILNASGSEFDHAAGAKSGLQCVFGMADATEQVFTCPQLVRRKKAEQIRQTGTKIVATNCFNCMTQIRDLSKAYDLGIEVKSIVEVVAESLVG